MKFNKLKYSESLILGLLFATTLCVISCTKNFTELNTPKNSLIADNINVSLLGQTFADAEFLGLCGDNQSFQRSHSLFSDVYAQYFAITEPNFQSGKFVEVQGWTNRYYNDIYSHAAPELLFVEHYTAKNSMPVANAIAKIWKVEMYHRISDFFGPVIYSQFGNGATSVPYDSQESAYTDFFKTLDSAVAILEQHKGENAFGSNDLVYGGDANKWLTFANSLRLRLAVRVSYVEPEVAKEEAEKAVAAGVMTDNTDNANVLCTLNNLNFYAAITYIDEFRMSATMESILGGYNDPRIEDYFTPAKDGSGYTGVRNGLPTVEMGAFLNNTHADINNAWRPLNLGGINPPLHVMEAAEVYFLRAEGALRGWNMGGTAEDLYNEGISTSMNQWGITSASEINTYLNSTNTPMPLNDKWNTPAAGNIPVHFDAAGTFERELEQIITQKWIALYPDSWEAWSERRRTAYPVGLPLIQSLNPDIPVDGMMRRLMFTTGEISSNAAAVEAARKLLKGPDANYTKLWWDAKP